MNNKSNIEVSIPENFRSILVDFSNDLSATFPEYSYLWSKWVEPDVSEFEIKRVFDYCLTVYPERFFDILYQNEDLFNEDSELNTYFLPNVSFRLLFNTENVSETTKKTMWKYLQLMLFTVVGCVKDKSTFGETMNMFDGINEEDLNNKLKEAMSGITDFFKNIPSPTSSDETDSSRTGGEEQQELPNAENLKDGFKKMFENMPNMKDFGKNFPNIEGIQEHLKSIFEGKIGSLAKEMAEEIAEEFGDLLGEDSGNIQNTEDVIKKLMKNPKKMMDLMKTISGKLDSKMKNGEISKEELMKEASELMEKMKDIGGKDQFNEMFKQFAKNMGGMGKNMKLDTNAMDRFTKQQSTKDRLRKKMELKKQQQQEALDKLKMEKQKQFALQQQEAAKFSLNQTDNTNSFKFTLDGEEKQEKSFIHPDLLREFEAEDKKKDNASSVSTGGKKKKKNKK
jgi:hypothetical protein